MSVKLVLTRISILYLELWPKIGQNESFRHFPRYRKKIRKWGKNESHDDNSWNLLHVLANFYMSGIFTSLIILVQTQLGHYLYHPISMDWSRLQINEFIFGVIINTLKSSPEVFEQGLIFPSQLRNNRRVGWVCKRGRSPGYLVKKQKTRATFSHIHINSKYKFYNKF